MFSYWLYVINFDVIPGSECDPGGRHGLQSRCLGLNWEVGSIPTRFRHLRGETLCNSGVFAFIAGWLKLSKNGNLCHYIATLNLKLARIAIKYVKMNQLISYKL